MVQYDSLSPERSEIRVLALLPGKSRDPIKCALHTVSLDDVPDFEALSYVWGDATEKKSITVDGEEFSATTNLEAALRAFRQPSKRRMLWVDAICINQDDVQEKNIQVPQMGRLYSTAKTVLVWLGPSSPNIEHFISWAQTYVVKSYTTTSAYWLKLDAKAAFSDSAKREKDWAILRALEGYFDTLALPYWNRMWTFQEYRLPQDEPLCYCGNITFRATTLLGRSQDAIHEVGFGILAQFMESLNTGRRFSEANKEGREWQEVAVKIQDTVRRLQSKSNIARDNIIVSPQKAREDWRNKESPLQFLLGVTAERKCFDMRDKVFALYGMVPAAQEVYAPDYTKPVKDVMLETTAYMVNYERGPIMWSSFGLRDDRLSDTSYPSWVPELTRAEINAPNMHRGLTQDGRLTESLRQWEDAPPARVTADLSTVHLWARSLGRCKVAFQFSSKGTDVLDQIRGLLKTDPLSLPEGSIGRTIRKPETLIPRMARACVRHAVRQSHFSTEELLKTFDIIFEYMKSGKRPEGSKGSCWIMIEEDAVENLVGKTLFVTEGGCFGIGVGGIKDGDIVTMPPQVRLPLVLTKELNTSRDSIEYFRMDLNEFLIH
ncbi:HET-domain-containing protein [Hypoxylon fuscum]|nr:HET-domain-containing protein [Hypoxylon fuscum]